MHNASAVHATQLFIDGKTGRDGLDLVNSRDILVEDSRIEGSYGVGRRALLQDAG